MFSSWPPTSRSAQTFESGVSGERIPYLEWDESADNIDIEMVFERINVDFFIVICYSGVCFKRRVLPSPWRRRLYADVGGSSRPLRSIALPFQDLEACEDSHVFMVGRF